MFELFKKKLKDVVDKFSKKTKEEVEEAKEEIKEKPEEKQKKILGLFKRKEKKEEVSEKEIKEKEEIKEKISKPIEEKIEKKVEEPKKEKKKFFEKIRDVAKIKISEEKFEKLFEELEIVLLENNVAYEVIGKIKENLKIDLVNVPISNVKKTIEKNLKETLEEVLNIPKLNIIDKINEIRKEGRSAVFLILGYNGSGKSITCAKLAEYLKNKNFKPLLAAGDTFRAAGSLQLANYAKLVEVPVIQMQQQGDSCALIFDAIKSANARKLDVVIADTAGRIHSNVDLMDELKKIIRVNKPDLKILILDSLTGNDVVEQCREFDKTVGVDALIFTKVDSYEKGGSLLSAAYILSKPILFLGTGQEMDSLKEYDKEEILNNLGF